MRKSLSYPIPRGFTLVELLVVIAIIGILVGLLLPAVQAAREAARRAECTNKLRQLALAAHNYHDAHQTFPPGALVYAGLSGARADRCPPRGGTNESGASWSVMILPFIEQDPLYKSLDFRLRFPGRFNITDASGMHNRQFIFRKNPAFLCPSNPRGGPDSVRTDYVGVAGGGCDVLPATACGPNVPGARCEGAAGRLYFENGIFFINRPVRFADIGDGTSNCYLFGETSYMRTPEDPGVGTNYPSWGTGIDLRWSPGGSGGHSSLQTMVAAALPINSPLVNVTDSGFFMRIFSSRHPGGCNMALADGSVRFFSQTMDLHIHRLLGVRDSGQVKNF